MSAPSPFKGRGRGIVKPRWSRWDRLPRKPEAADDELVAPEHVWSLPFARRTIPAGDYDPARARWIELLLRDPAAARRERLEQRLAYWRARLAVLEERERAALAQWREAAADLSRPESHVWELQAAAMAAWADVQHARAQAAALERELAQ